MAASFHISYTSYYLLLSRAAWVSSSTRKSAAQHMRLANWAHFFQWLGEDRGGGGGCRGGGGISAGILYIPRYIVNLSCCRHTLQLPSAHTHTALVFFLNKLYFTFVTRLDGKSATVMFRMHKYPPPICWINPPPPIIYIILFAAIKSGVS